MMAQAYFLEQLKTSDMHLPSQYFGEAFNNSMTVANTIVKG
jgi:hypothetical protein